MDIRGRVKVLHGQNRKTEEPPLALFAICTPFGPPSLLEIPQKEVMFKSKHKLDLGLVSMDQRLVYSFNFFCACAIFCFHFELFQIVYPLLQFGSIFMTFETFSENGVITIYIQCSIPIQLFLDQFFCSC